MALYWHVLATYLSRPRFWIVGGVVGFFLAATSTSAAFSIPPIFTSLLAGLLALHARRQFATPQAHLVPRFAGPHLVVVMVLLTVVWLIVPLAAASYRGYPLWPVVGAEALAVVIFALVLWWPKAIALVAVVPTVTIAFHLAHQQTFTARFIAGATPLAYATLLLAALAGYFAAAWKLPRLEDLSAAESDDFSFEQPRASYAPGTLAETMRSWRDSRIEWWLGRKQGGGASLAGRRVPSAVSWEELLLFGLVTLAAMPLAGWLFDTAEAAWCVLMVGAGLMLFAPLSLWRFRCNALAIEAMRPATREAFARQTVMAMGLDCATWCAGASVVVMAGFSMLVGHAGFTVLGLVAHVTILWGMTALIYGISILTLRQRFWLPMFVLLFVVGIVGGWSFTLLCEAGYHLYNRLAPLHEVVLVSSFSLALALIGLALAWHTTRRWSHTDLA